MSLALRGALLGRHEKAAQRALRYGLIAAWNLEEASGNRADSYGVSTLTDTNTVTANPFKTGGNAAQFTAANTEYLSAADSVPLSTGDINLWGSLWVYFDSLPVTALTLMTKGWSAVSVTREYVLQYDGSGAGTCSLHVSEDGTADSANVTVTAPLISTWAHLFWYHDAVANTIGLSIDGGAFATASHTTGLSDQASAFELGGNIAALLAMDGRMARVAFGKSPPSGITSITTEARNFLYNGGSGRRWPW